MSFFLFFFSRYGRVPCLEDSFNNLNKPNALGVRSVAGVFIMLGCGLMAGIILLFLEHFVFRYFLPKLRLSSKRSAWKSPNLMFFSQVRCRWNNYLFNLLLSSLDKVKVAERGNHRMKFTLLQSFPSIELIHFSFFPWQKLYRFVNTVELVSPHHSAKEIIASLKEGQITSLFQKSLKRVSTEVCVLKNETWVKRWTIDLFYLISFLPVLFHLLFLLPFFRKPKKKPVVERASRSFLKWFKRFEKCEYYPPTACIWSCLTIFFRSLTFLTSSPLFLLLTSVFEIRRMKDVPLVMNRLSLPSQILQRDQHLPVTHLNQFLVSEKNWILQQWKQRVEHRPLFDGKSHQLLLLNKEML